MEFFSGQITWILMVAVFVSALVCFSIYMQWHLEGRTGYVFKRQLDYEIYYGVNLIKTGVFQLKNNEGVRFGLSRLKEYNNNVVIENYLENIEDPDEADLRWMVERYNTWFSIKMVNNTLILSPAYSSKERRRAHKSLYIEDGDNIRELDKNGERFDGEIVVCASKEQDKSFKVIVYDRCEDIL